MNNKKITVKVQRVLQTTPSEAFKSWLNPKVPGNPWYEASKLVLNPKVNGLFYWYISGTPHYGQFTKIKKGSEIQHTWMSPYTYGRETKVTVTFKKKGKDTVMTLIHKGLPADSNGRGHADGWGYFLDNAEKKFKKKR